MPFLYYDPWLRRKIDDHTASSRAETSRVVHMTCRRGGPTIMKMWNGRLEIRFDIMFHTPMVDQPIIRATILPVCRLRAAPRMMELRSRL